jgi:SAM-dependent methyltransferase
VNRRHGGHSSIGEADDHGDDEADGHGHHGPERGWLAGFRYFKLVRKFWRSEVNNAVIAIVDPRPGEQLIDIGAGMGAGAIVAVKDIGRGSVTAVDPLPGMRLLLRARCLLPTRWGRIKVVRGTAESMPVPSGVADAAYATNALHHFDDKAAALVEVARVTKPGARVVFVEEQFTDPRHPSYERFGGDDHESHDHRFHSIDLGAMDEMATTAGFNVDQAEDTLVAGLPVKLIRLRRN